MTGKRTQKSIKNIAVAIVVQIITVLLSFVTRTLLVTSLGVESVSLNGLFTEVISMLSLTELGVGSAIIYNLYKPLTEGNKEKVCKLMGLFKTAYNIIALATFCIGVALLPVIHLLVNQVNYSKNYIRLVYFLFVLQTSVSYLFSYKVSLLNADQQKYIYSIIHLAFKGIGTFAAACILFTTYNYVYYLISVIFFNIMTNFVASIVVDKKYPYLKEDHGKLSPDETKNVFSNIKNLFIKNVSAKVTNSTDNILISTLVGTLSVGIYTNYSIILNAVKQFSVQISGALAGSLGNLFASEKSNHCIMVLDRLTFIFFIIASSLSVCLYCCITPFIEVWLGKDWILANSVIFICCVNLFLDFCKIPLWQSLEVSGLFKKDKNISIIGTTINLIISIILGMKMGISGIFWGTFATYVVQIVLKIHLLFKDYFNDSPVKYYGKWLIFFILTITEMLLCKLIIGKYFEFGGILQLFITALFGGLLSLIVNLAIFIRTDEMKYCYQLIRKIINISKR